MSTIKSIEQKRPRRWVRLGGSLVLICFLMIAAAVLANKEAALNDAAFIMNLFKSSSAPQGTAVTETNPDN